MATSGTTTFSVTRNNIIEASLRLLGVLEEGAQPTAQAIESASLVLNMMLKDWIDRKSTRLNSSHSQQSRMPSSA